MSSEDSIQLAARIVPRMAHFNQFIPFSDIARDTSRLSGRRKLRSRRRKTRWKARWVVWSFKSLQSAQIEQLAWRSQLGDDKYLLFHYAPLLLLLCVLTSEKGRKVESEKYPLVSIDIDLNITFREVGAGWHRRHYHRHSCNNWCFVCHAFLLLLCLQTAKKSWFGLQAATNDVIL